MSGQKMSKEDYARIIRLVCLLLNRAMMYKADHPHIKDAIINLHKDLTALAPGFSSLVLLLNRDQLFLDEEPVDPRINTSRIVALFKKTRVQSISFAAGIAVEEFQTLIDILTAPQKYTDCDKMTEELNSRGVQSVKINHVFYKKITRDDEIVSRRDRDSMTAPAAGGNAAAPRIRTRPGRGARYGPEEEALGSAPQALAGGPVGVVPGSPTGPLPLLPHDQGAGVSLAGRRPREQGRLAGEHPVGRGYAGELPD
jgi:hypothetical protein